MASIPAHNPPVPFLGAIPGGMSHGRMIRIKGFMQPYADRFTINLQCGPSTQPLDDVALHIDVRPGEGCIVRNHHSKEAGWGMEERFGGCPIQPGQPYEILILAQNNCYKIAVNGVHFCEFIHRLPLFRVQYLYILYDTTISYIGLEGDVPQHQPAVTSFVTATAPPSVPMTSAYIAPSYGAPPPYGMVPPQQHVIHQQIQPGPPPSAYNPGGFNAAAYSYGGIPPPYGTPPPTSLPVAAPYYNTTQPPSYAMSQQYVQADRGKSNNMLKYAAIAGGAGLTGLALGSILSSDGGDSD